MRLAIVYFFSDTTVFAMAQALAVPTGAGGAYQQADFDLCVKNSWPQGAVTAVCYQNSTTALSSASIPS